MLTETVQCIIDGTPNKYTSDRDPRVFVRVNILTSNGSGYQSTLHTLWSMDEANSFIERCKTARPMQTGYDFMDTGRDASAERLTSAEVGWLCTPLSETPPAWCKQPAALSA